MEWIYGKQGNRGYMRKIHVTRDFLEASGPQGHFFEKTKITFLDMVLERVCTKFQVCIVFCLARRSRTKPQTNKHFYK